ncbi:MAG: glycosyltransferase family 39 protein [Candidatus Bathyarchaeota archaeon]|nr:MAG: glycosyltransferase family 39 protein [Candidatus Bathyarchaeota archaeon]
MRILNIVQFVKGRLNKVPILVLLISIGIVNFLVLLPYLKWHMLIGWDTPLYMYHILYVEKYGVEATLMSGVIDRPLYALILYLLSGLGADPEQLLKVIPIVFGSFYIVSIYLLSKEGSHDDFLVSLATLFSSFSYATLRLAGELQPQLLALSCMMIAMYLHLRYVNNGNKRYIICSMIVALFMLGIHVFTYGVYIAILMLSFLIRPRAKRPQKRKREMINMIACSLPFVGVMIFLLFTSLRPIVALAGSLVNPRVISPLMSRLQLEKITPPLIPIFIFSTMGVLFLFRSRGTFNKMLLAWTASFLLAFLLGASLHVTFAYRFILILPLPILAAYGFRGLPKRMSLKYLLIAFVVTNLSIATLYRLGVKPWINEELRENLIWIRENLGDKLIIPVYPLDTSIGNWVLGTVGDYLYYGEVLSLLAKKPEIYSPYPNLDTSLYWKRLEDDEVLKNLSEYKIVLVGGVYKFGIVDEQITEKVANRDIYIVNSSVVTNETKIDHYYQVWREFKDAKIAIIGRDWLKTREILYELWIPSVPPWMATPPNIQYLGTTGLPTLDNSTEYDVLILANWDIVSDETEAEKLIEYFEKGCAIVALYESVYKLHIVSPQIVEAIFGTEEAYPPDVHYSNLTYNARHYITSNFSIPFNSTGAEYGVPVSKFTTAQGIATVTSFDELCLLAINQRNATRATHFGLTASEMSENDRIIFKRLLLWVLHFEDYQK